MLKRTTEKIEKRFLQSRYQLETIFYQKSVYSKTFTLYSALSIRKNLYRHKKYPPS